MKLYTPIILLLSLGLLTLGCRKELPPNAIGEPLFYAQASLDGLPLNIQAGVDAYLMDAEFDRDDFGINEFSGVLKPGQCLECSESLRLTIRDHRISQEGEMVSLDSALAVGPYLYRGGYIEPDPNSFSFKAHPGGQGPYEYQWDFGDGQVSTIANPSHTYNESGDFEVNLTITDKEGCNDVSRHQVSAGDVFNDCAIRFSYENLEDNLLLFSLKVDSSKIPSSLIFWSFGDGQSAAGTFDISHQFANPGIYEVKVVFIDGDGCFSCDLQNVYSLKKPSCASSITFKPLAVDREASKVSLEWIDAQGRLFTSYTEEGQPLESTFEILEVEAYDSDLDGDPTAKVKVRFSCRLFLEADPSVYIDVKDGEAVMALGLP